MVKLKRYEPEVELINSNKTEEGLVIKASANMFEKEEGEYVSIYDLPSWIRLLLGIKVF